MDACVDAGGAAAYGDALADVYDEWFADVSDVAGTVAYVAALAGAGGRVLELGIGTGRLALPLAAAGLRVSGIDASVAMVERLRAKPGGNGIEVAVGDMADAEARAVPPGARFHVVLVAFNTLFNLTSAEAQRRCLRGVAARLAPGGSLLVEAFVPTERPIAGPVVAVRSVSQGRVVLSISETDATAQAVTGRYVDVQPGEVRLRPWTIRYASPAEIDEMAAAAGLVLADRWSGWGGQPFTDASDHHISRYRPAC